MKPGLLKDLRLFQIRWRSRFRKKTKKSVPPKHLRPTTTLPLFSRGKSGVDTDQALCALHEVGHMVLLHYLTPTDDISIEIQQSDELEWGGVTKPNIFPESPDYLAKSFVAGFLAEVMANRIFSKVSYQECYNIFKATYETNSDYKGFQKAYDDQFGIQTLVISELEYYIAIHAEVYGYFLEFGINRMHRTAELLMKNGQCTFKESVAFSN